MKRLSGLLLAAALLLPAPTASAQTTLSVHGGLNLSVLSNELEDSLLPINYVRIVQPTFSLSATFRLSPSDATNSLGVRLSGSYSPKGGDLQGRSRSNLRLTYLELAALLDVRVPLVIEPLAVHILVGPSVGYLLSCERESPCADGEFNTLDYGLAFGGSLEVSLTEKLGITAGFLYNASFSHADARDDPSLLNRALALRGGVMIPIG